MSILEYSVAKKIYNNLLGISPAPDEIQIKSKKVDVSYTDLSGTIFVIDIGSIPRNSVLMHSQLDINTPFMDSTFESCMFSAGLGIIEETYLEYPIPTDYKEVIFDQAWLDSSGIVDAQGEKTPNDEDKTLNTKDNSLSLRFMMPGVWSTGSSLSSIRSQFDGCGSSQGGIVAGGRSTGGSYLTNTEEYRGGSYNSGGSLNQGRSVLRMAGYDDNALSFGGDNGGSTTYTESYNGAAWSNESGLNSAIDVHASAGSGTSALSFAGSPYNTEEWNGSSWTSQNDMIGSQYHLNGGGVQGAGIAFGGFDGSNHLSTTEEYNGTNWSAGNNMNSEKRRGADCSISSSALMMGGWDGSIPIALVEEYDGLTWIMGNSMNVAKRRAAGFGSVGDAVVSGGTGIAGGYATEISSEEYHAASLSDLTQGSLTFYVTYTHV